MSVPSKVKTGTLEITSGSAYKVYWREDIFGRVYSYDKVLLGFTGDKMTYDNMGNVLVVDVRGNVLACDPHGDIVVDHPTLGIMRYDPGYIADSAVYVDVYDPFFSYDYVVYDYYDPYYYDPYYDSVIIYY